MATGEFYTYNVWELRAGHAGRELEELTRLGIVPQYGRVKGIREILLFRIEEGDDAGKYMAVTVYESREAFNDWFTRNDRDMQVWQNSVRPTLERWVEVATQMRTHRATLILEHKYDISDDDNPPPPPPNAPRFVF